MGPFLAIYLATSGWNEERVGIALTAGGIAGIVAQTPAGALVDHLQSKRALIAVGAIGVGLGAFVIALFPAFWPVVGALILIGAGACVFVPAVAAISLGLVGHGAFDRRQGRNQTFNAAGNVVSALILGLLGYFVSNRSIFVYVMALTLPTLWSLRAIDPGQINHARARGSSSGDEPAAPVHLAELLKNRTMAVFLLCAVLFHFANAAMLPLLGEMLSKGQGRSSMVFMSACVITTQVVVTLLASWSGVKACEWGRKPMLLIAFGALPVRGVLYTLTHDTRLLVAIQLLDGLAAAIFGVVSVLVIADLTKGSGRFNLVLGAVTAAVGTGAALSQLVAGSIALHFGTRVGFLFLAAVAAAGFALLALGMPETRSGSGDA